MKNNTKADVLGSLTLILKVRKAILLARIDMAEAAKKLTPERAQELRETLR